MASEPGLSAGLRQGAAPAPDAAPRQATAADDDLLKRASQGDPRAWEAIVHRYGPAVHLAAAQHGLPPADVAATESTTWLRLVEHLDRLEHVQWVEPWLTRTADGEARRLLARRTVMAGQ